MTDDNMEFFRILFNEYERARISIQYTDDQFTRRAAIRVFFSTVEGENYFRNHWALTIFNEQSKKLSTVFLHPDERKDFVKFKEPEIAILKGEEYFLNSNGKAKKQKLRLRFIENFLFSMAMMAKAIRSNFELDVGGNGWDSFRKAVKIRDRITHPKNKEDFNVTDEDIEIFNQAVMWYLESQNQLLEMSDNSSKLNDSSNNSKHEKG